MESSRNLFINHHSHTHATSNSDTIDINDARAMWNSGTTPRIDYHWSTPLSASCHQVATTPATTPATPRLGHALMVKTHAHGLSPYSSCLYSCNSNGGEVAGGGAGGGGCGSGYPDPHLMCLKLGKRHYFGDAANSLGDRQGVAVDLSMDNAASNGGKRGKPYNELVGGTPTSSSSSGVTVAAAGPTVAVPRCQVDGCHVVLLNAKDYHRRHKVCEMHSKAPKVVVLGLEQRFCQQCSRFHAVGEFDESKRSCRRRLAGHNERRRKSSQDQSTPRNQPHQVNRKLMMSYGGGKNPQFPVSSGCALSLLSSKNDPWVSSSGDLPARCSAALRELIAENRAAILARQLILDKDWQWHRHHHHQPAEDAGSGRQNGGSNSQAHYQPPPQMGSISVAHGWDRMSESGGHVTLDLMQAPTSAFGFLSVRGKSKEDDQECPDLWGASFRGAHVV